MSQAEESAASRPGPSADACRLQLGKILQSPDFEATAREQRFLGHVVEEALSGRGSRIKAYSIAVEVFGRDASFDPQSDPIVRIEAGHLRRALERYYLIAGQADPVLITIPKGGYVPHFALRLQPTPADAPLPDAPGSASEFPVVQEVAETRPAPRSRWQLPALLAAVILALVAAAAWWRQSPLIGAGAPEVPRLLVATFEDLTGTASSAAIAKGLTQEVISQISKFKDIIVVEEDPQAPAAGSPPRFVLAGSVDLTGESFRLRVRVLNRDGSVLWANSYDGGVEVAELIEAQTDVARNVATTLAQTYGVIFQADAALKIENPSDDWAAYSCTLSYYSYRATLDPKERPSVRACLERAVERFPGYATAWGLLSQTYVDELRFNFPFDPGSSPALTDRALTAARRAVELDSLNIRGLQAEMFALYLTDEIDSALSVGKRAMAINPNDTELMGEYGYRLAVSGKWEEGCALVAEARERNPGPLAYYESGLALCSYFDRDFQQAAMWIKKTTAPGNPLYHTIAAAIFGEGGYELEAERERVWLEGNEPALVKNFRREATLRLARAEDVEFFLGSLRKAGFDIAD